MKKEREKKKRRMALKTMDIRKSKIRLPTRWETNKVYPIITPYYYKEKESRLQVKDRESRWNVEITVTVRDKPGNPQRPK